MSPQSLPIDDVLTKISSGGVEQAKAHQAAIQAEIKAELDDGDLGALVAEASTLMNAAALSPRSAPVAAWLAQRNIPALGVTTRVELEAFIQWLRRGLNSKPEPWQRAAKQATTLLRQCGAPHRYPWKHPAAMKWRDRHPTPTTEDLEALAETLGGIREVAQRKGGR